MVHIAIAIEKQTPWRGGDERFSNVYHYDVTDGLVGQLGALVNVVVNAEKQVHAGVVEFMLARVWEAGGTPAENETLLLQDLSGGGAAVNEPSMDREATYLVQFKTNRPSSTGRPVTLKKFLHACSTLGVVNEGQLSGINQIDAGVITTLKNYGENVRGGSINGEPFTLRAPSSNRVAGEPFVFPYIEHHEFTY